VAQVIPFPSGGPSGARASRPTVLVAVDSPALARLVEHLLHVRHGVALVGRVADAAALVGFAGRFGPDLVVANLRLLGREPGQRIAELRSSSPGSKLILVSPEERLAAARRLAADAWVGEEALVRRLLAVVHRLSRRTGPVLSQARQLTAPSRAKEPTRT
jgi:hypothetical protein